MALDHPGITGRKPGRKLPTRKVCEKYNVVPRTLDRWDQRPELEFPKPEYINGRKYRDEALLDEWDRRRAALSAGGQAPRRKMPPHKAAQDETTAA